MRLSADRQGWYTAPPMALGMIDEWLVLDAIDKNGPQTREQIETTVVMAIHTQCGLTRRLFHTLFSTKPSDFTYLLHTTLANCFELLGGKYALSDHGRRHLNALRVAHGPDPYKRLDSLWAMAYGGRARQDRRSQIQPVAVSAPAIPDPSTMPAHTDSVA
jgi:hypothetical protein